MPVVVFSVLVVVVLFAAVVLCVKKAPRESTAKSDLPTSINMPTFTHVSNPVSQQQAQADGTAMHTSAISEQRLVCSTQDCSKIQPSNVSQQVQSHQLLVIHGR